MKKIEHILTLGEDEFTEFKQNFSSSIDKEIVAMANGRGGSIYLGVSDDSEIIGIDITNKLLSQVRDVVRNCDPANIEIELIKHKKYPILEIKVGPGIDKPYRCSSGFFIRLGPNSQKLNRNEIKNLIIEGRNFYYDQKINKQLLYPRDLNESSYEMFIQKSGIDNFNQETILESIEAIKKNDGYYYFTNAGALFFARDPQKHLRESYLTCIRYDGTGRFKVKDRQDIYGNIPQIINDALLFFSKHNQVAYEFNHDAQRIEIPLYPPIVIREAIINAVAHRDYYFDSSCIYFHFFDDRIEIENPGGLYHFSLKDLGKKSIRRNPLLCGLLLRMKYVERIGSGIPRIINELEQNLNPMFEAQSTNFFSIHFYPRPMNLPSNNKKLSSRQLKIINFIKNYGPVTKAECAQALTIGLDTTYQELRYLKSEELIYTKGKGRATRYYIF